MTRAHHVQALVACWLLLVVAGCQQAVHEGGNAPAEPATGTKADGAAAAAETVHVAVSGMI